MVPSKVWQDEITSPTVYPQGILSNGVTEKMTHVHIFGKMVEQVDIPSKISTTKQSPGSAPSTAIGPLRLCTPVRSTFLISSLSGTKVQYTVHRWSWKLTDCHCCRSELQSNLAGINLVFQILFGTRHIPIHSILNTCKCWQKNEYIEQTGHNIAYFARFHTNKGRDIRTRGWQDDYAYSRWHCIDLALTANGYEYPISMINRIQGMSVNVWLLIGWFVDKPSADSQDCQESESMSSISKP